MKIGVIGLGTVGYGVIEILTNEKTHLEKEMKQEIVVKYGCGLEEVDLPKGIIYTKDYHDVINDEEIDVVVELIGGTTIAKNIILEALNNKKHVVTANKALLAHYGKEIFQTAKANDVHIFYEASVGGGIPVLASQKESLIANNTKEIVGILNGTTNFILTLMENENLDFDEALSIDAIKRFIAEQDLNAQTRHIPEVVIPASIHMDHFDEKIAIIGAGPAGLTAAFYLAETGYRPTVFEKSEHPGGMLRYGIPSYKLEKDLLDAEIDVAKAMGVEIKTGIEVGKDVTIQQLRERGYKAFYIAIGCAAGRLPGLENENAEGVMTAIDYLYDANCGNAPFAGKVVVVGGGNVAIDASRVSARNAASSVLQFSLEQEQDMPASVEEIKEAREDGVTINCGWGPKEILVENGKVTGIVFKKCLSVINDGKFAPVYDENETMTVECDRLIFAIGQQSVWKDLLKGEDVKFNGPAIELNQVTFQSSKEDIFAGGDVYTGPKFAIDAIAQGKIAAESLHRYVHNGHMETGRNRWEFKQLDTDDILVESYDRGPKQVEGINLEVKDRFKDNTQILTEEQIKKETARCLGCGATIVDANKCIGCGVCTTKCEFDAIKLHRDHPECSNMVVAEDKFKAIIPYQLKRVKNIILKKKVEH